MQAIATRLKELLAASSPFAAADIADDTRLEELGMSSLQVQIVAGQIEAAFEMRFEDGDLGEVVVFGDLVAMVERRRGQPA